MWKRLQHPNIVPLCGVTVSPLQLVSEWMPGGELREYIRKNRDANILDLVGVTPVMSYRALTPARYLMLLKPFTFSTLGTSSTVA